MDKVARLNNLHQLMMKKGKLIRRVKKQVIQTTDTQKYLYLVKLGFVKRYMINNDGSLGVDLIYGPGDVFSLTLVFRAIFEEEILDSPEVYYYEALTTTDLYAMPIERLLISVEKDPMLYKDILNEAGKRMTSATQGLENKEMKNSYKKVAHQLAYYAGRFGHAKGSSVVLLPSLTHQDIADILSLTRETVSVCMMKLRKKGLIKIGRQIVVPDIKKLTDEAFN